MTARARLDADRTAEPLTRIEHHPPHGGCVSPYMPLVNPEYVDETGKRTPLSAPAEASPALTPSEVALAKVLAAWEDWPGAGGAMNPVDHAMRAVGSAINDYGMVSVEQEGLVLSDKGSALLDRARKAGVL